MGFLKGILYGLIIGQTLLRADDLKMLTTLYDQAIRDQLYETPRSFQEHVIGCYQQVAPNPPTGCSQHINGILNEVHHILTLFETINFILIKGDSIVAHLEEKRILWRGTPLFSTVQNSMISKKQYISENQDRLISTLKRGLCKTLKTEICTKTRATWGGWAGGLWASASRKINRLYEEGGLWDTDPEYTTISPVYKGYASAYAPLDLMSLRYYNRPEASGSDVLALFQAFLAINDRDYFTKPFFELDH